MESRSQAGRPGAQRHRRIGEIAGRADHADRHAAVQVALADADALGGDLDQLVILDLFGTTGYKIFALAYPSALGLLAADGIVAGGLGLTALVPLALATKSFFPSAETATAVGYQPAGMYPSSSRSGTSMTAIGSAVLWVVTNWNTIAAWAEAHNLIPSK